MCPPALSPFKAADPLKRLLRELKSERRIHPILPIESPKSNELRRGKGWAAWTELGWPSASQRCRATQIQALDWSPAWNRSGPIYGLSPGWSDRSSTRPLRTIVTVTIGGDRPMSRWGTSCTWTVGVRAELGHIVRLFESIGKLSAPRREPSGGR